MGPSLAPAMAESNPVTFVGFMPPLPAGLASAAPGSQSVVAGAAAAERNAARPGAARISRRDGPSSLLFLEDALTTTLEMRRGFDGEDVDRADFFRSAAMLTRTLAGTSAALEVSANILSARGVG
jgi:hypothetical protein